MGKWCSLLDCVCVCGNDMANNNDIWYLTRPALLFGIISQNNNYWRHGESTNNYECFFMLFFLPCGTS